MINKIKAAAKNLDNKRLAKNFVSLAILKGFDYLVPLITMPYLIRTVGLELYGLSAFALSLAIYFGAIMQFGFGVSAVREVATHRNDIKKLSSIYSETLSVSILLTLICLAIFSCLVINIDELYKYRHLYLYSFFFISMQSLFPVWFFQGMEEMKYITYINLLSRLFFLVSLLILITEPKDYYLVPLLNGLCMLASTCAAIWIIRNRFLVRFNLPHSSRINRVIIDGRHAFISQLAPTLYNNSSTFLLGIVAPHNVVGVFSAATKLIDVANSVAYLLTNTFLPYLTRNLKNFNRFSTLMIITGFLLTVFVIIFAPFLTRTLFSTSSLEVIDHTRALATSIFFSFISITFGTTYLIASNSDRKLSKITALTSLFFGCCGGIATLIFGIWGAVLTIVLCRLALALLFTANYLGSNPKTLPMPGKAKTGPKLDT